MERGHQGTPARQRQCGDGGYWVPQLPRWNVSLHPPEVARQPCQHRMENPQVSLVTFRSNILGFFFPSKDLTKGESGLASYSYRRIARNEAGALRIF